MEKIIQLQALQKLSSLLLLAVFTFSGTAQTVKISKYEPCSKTITFQTKTTVREYLDVEINPTKRVPEKRGQFSLCINQKESTTYSGKGAYPKNLLEIEEFVVALRQSARDLRPDFNPLIRDAQSRGAIVQKLRNGTVSLKHRLRGGGQWITLIDLNRQMLLGCSEYDKEGFLVRKLVCHYFTDGRRPPQIQYTVFSEYQRQTRIKEIFIKETITYLSEPEVSTFTDTSRKKSKSVLKF